MRINSELVLFLSWLNAGIFFHVVAHVMEVGGVKYRLSVYPPNLSNG